MCFVRRTLNVVVEGNIIPKVRNPNILGVTHDNLLDFAAHATNINAKLKIRNKVLKELAGSTWGIYIITTYKAIGRSLLNYAVPIYSSFLSDIQWRILQTKQNNALHIDTGCLKMKNIDILHEELCCQ